MGSLRHNACSMAKVWAWQTGSRAFAQCSTPPQANLELMMPAPAAKHAGDRARISNSSRKAIRCAVSSSHYLRPLHKGGLPAVAAREESPKYVPWTTPGLTALIVAKCRRHLEQLSNRATPYRGKCLQAPITQYMPGKTRGQRGLPSIPESAADKAADAADEPSARRRRGRGAALDADAGVGALTGILQFCWWRVSQNLGDERAQGA